MVSRDTKGVTILSVLVYESVQGRRLFFYYLRDHTEHSNVVPGSRNFLCRHKDERCTRRRSALAKEIIAQLQFLEEAFGGMKMPAHLSKHFDVEFFSHSNYSQTKCSRIDLWRKKTDQRHSSAANKSGNVSRTPDKTNFHVCLFGLPMKISLSRGRRPSADGD